MKKLPDKISSLSSSRLLVISLLIGCILLSYYATFTGFYDLLSQSVGSPFWKISIGVLFAFAVQFSVFHFSKQWWKTRNRNYLLPLAFSVFVSVIFAWGFYFNQLGIDKVLAGNIYNEERSKIRDEVSFNQALIDNLIQNIDELVVHSQSMIENEKRGLHTCDVTLQGYGPRAAYRQQDVDTFQYYKNRFGYTRGEFDRVHKDITADSFREYSVFNAEALNDHAQKLNGIIKDFDEHKKNLLGFLRDRIRHNTPGFSETFDNGIFREDIRCPDNDIERYLHYLDGMASFNEISTVNILNPNRTGVQVSQAFDMLVNLLSFDFSNQEFLALLLALLVDLLIISLTYSRPNSSPPASLPSWPEYFLLNEYQELMKLLKLDKGGKGHFYIPTNKDYLIASMVPLLSDDLIIYQGRIPWWLAPFLVPDYIREQNNSSCFNHYQINIHCLAKWVLDHKNKQRHVTNLYGDKKESSLHSSSSDKGNADLVFNSASTPKSSLNGSNSKGVENDIR